MSLYNANAQIYDSQFVIRDSTTVTSSTNGGLVIEGGVSSRDTFVTGDISINSVDITPNPNDMIFQRQYAWNTVPETNTYVDIPELFFVNEVVSTLRLRIHASVTLTNGERLASTWDIIATQKNNAWSYTSSFTGDVMNLDFTITNTTKTINDIPKNIGQVRYTTTYPSGFLMYTATTTAPDGISPTTTPNRIGYTSGSFVQNGLVYKTTDNRLGYTYDVIYNVTSGVLTTRDVIPSADEAYDLGSQTSRWRDLWISGQTIHLGDADIKYTSGTLSLGDNNTSLICNNIVASGSTHTLGNITIASGGNMTVSDLNVTDSIFVKNRGVTYSYNHIWTTRGSAANNNWEGLCWSPELSLFCAVANTGTGNRVMTSPDGITWTSRASPDDIAWTSVCWSPELGIFCAVASSGTQRAMTSPDGINWTLRSTAETNNLWTSVCWAAEIGLFCAVATGGTIRRIMTSPDGITWTSRTAPSGQEWFSVCWSPELRLLCAVASSGTTRVMFSQDGITWTGITPPAGGWRTVCWSPELSLFCATSWTGGDVMTSVDAINWRWHTETVKLERSLRNVCWAAELGLFFGIAQSGVTTLVMTSPDGINWTPRSTPTDRQWTPICWAPELGRLCVTGRIGTGDRVMTSDAVITATGGSTVITQARRRLAIGHYTPKVTLDVKGSIRATNQILSPSGNASAPGISFYGDTNTGLQRPSADTLAVITGSIERLRVTSAGNIGIGTTNPTVPLDITSSVSSDLGQSLRYTQLGAGATVGNSGGNWTGVATSLKTSHAILSKEIYLTSDIRIKKDIIDLNDSTALETLEQLEPKRYRYIDTLQRTDSEVFGFSAQQVRQVLPHGVSLGTDFVPNVYSPATVVHVTTSTQNVEGEVVTITKTHLVFGGNSAVNTSTLQSKTIRCYVGEEDTEIVTNVIGIIDENTIEIDTYIPADQSVFVYGQRVEDFHVLNKDVIWTVSTAALQEIDRQLQEMKDLIVARQNKIDALLQFLEV